MSYATGTTVSADRSKNEIEAILKRYGADQFVSGWGKGKVMLGFRMGNRMIRFNLPIPDPASFKTYTATRSWRGRTTEHERTRSDSSAEQAFDQELRRRWRSLSLVIKAKLEAVESKITTFEEEFLAHVVLPGGKTVWEESREHIKLAYESGKVQGNLLGFAGGQD